MRVAVAGTFGPIHDGHREMFRAALANGADGVVVGISSDAFATASRQPDPRPIPAFEDRRRRVATTMETLDEWGRDVEIRKFDDAYGFADEDPTLDALVVSPETEAEVAAINRRRRQRDLPPLEPIVVPYVYAADGDPISSTRIVAGEIDDHGRLLE